MIHRLEEELQHAARDVRHSSVTIHKEKAGVVGSFNFP